MTKRVLLDTNIILDVLFRWKEWVENSGGVWGAHVKNDIAAYVTATTVTDIFYVVRRQINLETARDAVTKILQSLEVVAVDQGVLFYANQLAGNDFEDNVQIACVVKAKLDAIVTRDKTGFKLATVPVLLPGELLAQIQAEKEG